MTYLRYPGSLRIGVRNQVVSRAEHPAVEQIQPKQMLLVLMNGHQRFRLGEEEFLLSTRMPADPGPKALMLRIGCESRLEYLESHGHPLVKIAISTDPDWLDEAGQEDDAPAKAGSSVPETRALYHRLWTLDAEMEELARAVIELHRGLPDQIAPGDPGSLALMSRAIELYRAALQAMTRGPLPASATSDPQITRLAAYIASHLEDETLCPEAMARACGMGLRSLQRLCRRLLDCSPSEFIRRQRLDAAFVGLSRCHMNVAQAAYIAGYSSTASFSTAFKREFGMTPANAQSERDGEARHPGSVPHRPDLIRKLAEKLVVQGAGLTHEGDTASMC